MINIYRWLLTGSLYATYVFLLGNAVFAWDHGRILVTIGFVILSSLMFAAAQWTTPPRRVVNHITIANAPNMEAEVSGDSP